MLTQVHLLLAGVSALTTALLALEAGWRAIRNAPHSALSGRLGASQLIALAITSIVGLVLVASGAQPNQSAHFLLAFGAMLLPLMTSTVTHGAGQRWRAAVTSLTALLALGAVALLFITG